MNHDSDVDHCFVKKLRLGFSFDGDFSFGKKRTKKSKVLSAYTSDLLVLG